MVAMECMSMSVHVAVAGGQGRCVVVEDGILRGQERASPCQLHRQTGG